MNLTVLQQQTLQGWNTWYNESVTTHVLLPYGFAINLSFRKASNGAILRNPLITGEKQVRPDVRSWDGSYTCLFVNHEKMQFKVESAVKGSQQYILVTPTAFNMSESELIVELAFLWGKDGCLEKKNGELCGICPDGTRIPVYTSGDLSSSFIPELQSISKVLLANIPVVVSTVPCKATEARRIMDEARAEVLKEINSFGDHSEVFGATQSVVAWNTIYDPIKNRICTPVARTWNRGMGSRLFCWDTFFVANLAALGNKDIAYLNIKAILDEALDNGMVPGITDLKEKSYDRSQPPVGSMVVVKLWEKYKDIDFIKEVYPKLFAWNTWFYKNRRTADGDFCWGSKLPQTGVQFVAANNGINELMGAKYESGMDNLPIFDEGVYDKQTGLCLIADTGLTGLFIKDCTSLIILAEAAGYAEDISELIARKECAEKSLMKLWSEEDGMFENKDLVTGELSKRLAASNFYCLFSSKLTEEQKQSVIEKHLLNPEEFWGEYVIPNISRNDPAYVEQNYWRGRIWAPVNAIVYEALKDVKYIDVAKMLADKSEKLLLKEWCENRRVHENYHGDTGMGCMKQSESFYHWGALLGYIAIDAGEL